MSSLPEPIDFPGIFETIFVYSIESQGDTPLIVRKIRPEELKRTNELFSVAFEYQMENDKSDAEVLREVIDHPKTRGDAFFLERWGAFEADNTTMMSNFITTPYPIHFDGHSCTMVGIGGVATLPQYRRRGGIRACFEAALPAMYEDCASFSYLYPFSTAYYRKFGYEMCCERYRYKIRLNMLRPYPVEGTCFLLEPGHSFQQDIQSVYQTWQNRYNLMVQNETYEYAWIASSNPVKDQIFTYLYKSADGQPKGYMSFLLDTSSGERNLRCTRFVFTDTEGFKGLMNLALSCASDHAHLIFELPTDQFITPLIPEWSMGAGTCEKLFCGMVRVVNVKKVLEDTRYQGNGALILEITDAQIAANNRRFLVTFTDGAATSVTESTAPADIALGIHEFSRLITGACNADEIPFLPDVQVFTDTDALSKVFYKKPTLLLEYF